MRVGGKVNHILLTNDSDCCGCNNCLNICPKKAIKMVENKEGFLYPIVNEKRCINCGLCKKICPMMNSLSNNNLENNITCYAARIKNNSIRNHSTSGGLFTAIANYIIDNNGLVYGSHLNKEHKVYHIEIKKNDDLKKLRGSKYVYSDLGNIFTAIKENLKRNKLVLFVGVPCQVAALKLFLNQDYDNLVTIDLICHGTPNNKLFDKYLQYIEKKHNIKIINYEFRSKKYKDWHDCPFTVNIVYEKDNKVLNRKQNLKTNLYYETFLKGKNYRESCYQCKYATKNRVSDITLGDFWGIEKVTKHFGDANDVSSIIISTSKGQRIFDSITEEIACIKVNFDDIARYNRQLIQPTLRPKCRDSWYKDFNKSNFINRKQLQFYIFHPIKRIMPIKLKKYVKKLLNRV